MSFWLPAASRFTRAASDQKALEVSDCGVLTFPQHRLASTARTPIKLTHGIVNAAVGENAAIEVICPVEFRTRIGNMHFLDSSADPLQAMAVVTNLAGVFTFAAAGTEVVIQNDAPSFPTLEAGRVLTAGIPSSGASFSVGLANIGMPIGMGAAVANKGYWLEIGPGSVLQCFLLGANLALRYMLEVWAVPDIV